MIPSVSDGVTSLGVRRRQAYGFRVVVTEGHVGVGLSREGMAQFPCNFGQWQEHESPFCHSRVRQGECRAVSLYVAPRQQVNVDGTVGVVAVLAFLRAA